MTDNQLDRNRLQALSRARGLANAARSPYNGRYRLQGISVGDVLDYSDRRLFLAVTFVRPEGLQAEAVSQEEPWVAVRQMTMAAYALWLRLNNGWLSKVPGLRR